MRRLVALCLLLSAMAGQAATDDELIGAVGLEQKIGASLPEGLAFVDEHARRVTLGELIGRRPVILAPVWFSCPHLCSVTLQGLVTGLNGVDFDVGKDFDVVAFSIDPRDDVADATRVKGELLAQYRAPETAAGWHLLTGSDAAIRRLASALGVRYGYDEASGQYAHPATVLVVDADGRIGRYLPGVSFPARTLRLALIEAGRDQLGSLADQVLLRCFSYDPSTGRYSLAIIGVLRLFGSATLVVMAVLFATALRRERHA